jgi:hypothetical protein
MSATTTVNMRRGTLAMGSRAADEARALDTLQHMTRIGTLADDVVRATLAVARGASGAAIPAVVAAASLVRAAAGQLEKPLDVSSAAVDAETVSVLSAFGHVAETKAPSGDGGADEEREATARHLRQLADMLDRIASGTATPDDVREVREHFDVIGRVTLSLASQTVRPRTSLAPWPPVLNS